LTDNGSKASEADTAAHCVAIMGVPARPGICQDHRESSHAFEEAGMP
jgi:hypothetical protein